MKKLFWKILIIGAVGLVWVSTCLAYSGKVSSPDGEPVVGAKVRVMREGRDLLKLVTDPSGRFTLPETDFADSFIHIAAPDGKKFAGAYVPAKMFQGGELSIVLHPKK
jgi:hypothetical protein